MTTHTVVFVIDGSLPKKITNCHLDIEFEKVSGNPLKLCSTLKAFLMVEDKCPACLRGIKEAFGMTLEEIVSGLDDEIEYE